MTGVTVTLTDRDSAPADSEQAGLRPGSHWNCPSLPAVRVTVIKSKWSCPSILLVMIITRVIGSRSLAGPAANGIKTRTQTRLKRGQVPRATSSQLSQNITVMVFKFAWPLNHIWNLASGRVLINTLGL